MIEQNQNTVHLKFLLNSKHNHLLSSKSYSKRYEVLPEENEFLVFDLHCIFE